MIFWGFGALDWGGGRCRFAVDNGVDFSFPFSLVQFSTKLKSVEVLWLFCMCFKWLELFHVSFLFGLGYFYFYSTFLFFDLGLLGYRFLQIHQCDISTSIFLFSKSSMEFIT